MRKNIHAKDVYAKKKIGFIRFSLRTYAMKGRDCPTNPAVLLSTGRINVEKRISATHPFSWKKIIIFHSYLNMERKSSSIRRGYFSYV